MLAICLIILLFIYVISRLTTGFTKSSTCLVGKTAIVTGANSGIGFQTVLTLASRGCKVIMADCEDMENARKNAINFTNNKNITTKKLNLLSFKSIRDFANDVLQTEEGLDILINNAGIAAAQTDQTEDGYHPVMQVNYFGPFLLTHLLIDLLKKTAPSRIVFTSSFFAFIHNLSLENMLHCGDNGNPFKRLFIYSNSKMALLIASDVFAEKLKGTGVTSNSINPGICKTTITSKFYSVTKNTSLLKIITDLYQIVHSKHPWEGAQVLVHVAVSKELDQVSGKHFWDCRPFLKPFGANNKKFCQDIWEATVKHVKLKPEERL